MREEIHDAAFRMLSKSGLPKEIQQELYSLYLEDVEEHSESYALEAMHDAIQDQQSDDKDRIAEEKVDRMDLEAEARAANINEDDWREDR